LINTSKQLSLHYPAYITAYIICLHYPEAQDLCRAGC
jgi:hypothetical protein